MKKFFGFILFLGLFAALLPLSSVSAAEEEGTVDQGIIDLNSINLGDLEYGEKIIMEDFEVTKHTQEEVDRIFPENKLKNKTEKFTQQARSCAAGATSFRRALTVRSSSGAVLNYKPTAEIWTELCTNSSGNYVVKSIVGVTLDRSSNSTVKGYDGTILSKALNSGNTLFYAFDGNWYNNASSTTGTTIGGGTPVFSADINASSTTSFFGYTNQSENISLR